MDKRLPRSPSGRGRGRDDDDDDSREDEPVHNTLDPELARFASNARPLDEIDCPACAERIKAKAKVCKHCGHEIGAPVASKKRERDSRRLVRAAVPVVVQTKSPGVAAVLAFFLIGLGHIYCGRIGKGLALMFVWPALLFGSWIFVGASVSASQGANAGANALVGLMPFVWLVAFGVWVWQIYDAHSTASHAGRPSAFRSARRRR